MPDQDPPDDRPIDMHPGIGANPMAPAFRDGPRREPRSARSLVLEIVPFLVLVGVVVFFASR